MTKPAYYPGSPDWDLQPPTSALDVKIQAEIIVLRYCNFHTEDTITRTVLERVAGAIRALPIGEPNETSNDTTSTSNDSVQHPTTTTNRSSSLGP